MSEHTQNLREFAGEFGHLWDEERLNQVHAAAAAIEFLMGQFQMHSPDMGGKHRYRFRNDGWPMTHFIGPNSDAALRNALAEIDRAALEAI